MYENGFSIRLTMGSPVAYCNKRVEWFAGCRVIKPETAAYHRPLPVNQLDPRSV